MSGTTNARFSSAFERLCNFLAIERTHKGDEVLRELLLRCPLVFPDVRFQHVADFHQALLVGFGLDMPVDRLQTAIDQLTAAGLLRRPAATNLIPAPEVRERIERQIQEARGLEGRVRDKWLEECTKKRADIEVSAAWAALQHYLTRAFDRHGMQTVSLSTLPSTHRPNTPRVFVQSSRKRLMLPLIKSSDPTWPPA